MYCFICPRATCCQIILSNHPACCAIVPLQVLSVTQAATQEYNQLDEHYRRLDHKKREYERSTRGGYRCVLCADIVSLSEVLCHTVLESESF